MFFLYIVIKIMQNYAIYAYKVTLFTNAANFKDSLFTWKNHIQSNWFVFIHENLLHGVKGVDRMNERSF